MNNKQDIRDRVKTYEDACRVLGIETKTPELPNIPERDRRGVTAYYKLIIIARALNEGWEPDWKDREQGKLVPYFYFDRENNTTAGFASASTSSTRLRLRLRPSAPGFASRQNAKPRINENTATRPRQIFWPGGFCSTF